MVASVVAADEAPTRTSGLGMVVAGASLGTMFEWYDFFLYGSLAGEIAKHFFAAADERTAFVFALAAFAAGFIARPFGALVFGRVGDLVGRKNTFLVTMTLMGLSTFLVGVLPDYAAIGPAAPVVLLSLRLLQGLAIGGEYGGAVVYIGEHARPDRRGFATGWVNIMATGGLLASLLVIIAFRTRMTPEAFSALGWRGPFLVSAALLAISIWVRLRLNESPVFRRMKEEAALSSAPYAECFGSWENVKLMLAALFGPVSGQAVIWYAGGFYVLFFLQRVLKLADLQTDYLLIIGLALAAPTYVLAAWLSDIVGRKPVILVGAALGTFAVFPLFHALTYAANPALAQAQARAPVMVYADPGRCSVQFDPIGASHFDSSGCDIAKAFLSRTGISYQSRDLPPRSATIVTIGGLRLASPDPPSVMARKPAVAAFAAGAKAALNGAGYPSRANPARVDSVRVVLIVIALVSIAAMIYGPTAAILAELFPARIRYTSISVPYHIGAGWIGGLMPATAFAIVAGAGDIYAGLWYPVGFAALSFFVSLLFLPETRGRSIET